jgi:hypothetical protein
MIPLVNITNQANRYSKNLFSEQSLINDNSVINYNYNTVSGGYTLSEKDSFTGVSKAIKAYVFQNVISGISVNFDFDNALKYTADKDGNYIFQYSFMFTEINANPNTLVDFNVKMFKNSILVETFTNTINLHEFEINKYYNFAQSFNLNEGDLIDFSFSLERPSIGSPNFNFEVCFDGFKLEKNSYNFSNIGIPSIYSLPIDLFSLNNNTTGWEQITDTTYTSGSPLTISSGVTAKILNNAGSRINTQLPLGIAKFWNESTNKIVAVNNGDAFTLSLRFRAKMNVANGIADIGINIGGSLNTISAETLLFSKGSGVEQRFDVDLSYFTGRLMMHN